MRTSLYRLQHAGWETHSISELADEDRAHLVLCFAPPAQLRQDGVFDVVRQKFPAAAIVFCSTAGEIYQESVLDNSFVAVAIQFDNTSIESSSVNVKEYDNTYNAAMSLAQKIKTEDLAHVLVFSDGSLVNGSELVKGLSMHMEKNVFVTGGLAGDGADFKSTLVGLNQQPAEGEIVAIGLYGSFINVRHGSQNGWDIFGLQKRVTKASGNVLIELEEQNALELYKKYLGEEAKNLPSSALLFPLSVILPGATKPVVRTILSINEEEKSMTFAGDIPVGSAVRFMKTDMDKLIMAAAQAAADTKPDDVEKPDFSLLISCVGRKLVLNERTNEEVEAISKTFDHKTVMAGFYSYGEIASFNEAGCCYLHNQTITITSFYENKK